MAQSRQTPRVWADAIRGSEILANWLKLGTSAVFFWLTIGLALGAAVGGFWFFEGTSSLDRRLWVHHVRNGVGIGGRIADLPNPDGSGTRIQMPKGAGPALHVAQLRDGQPAIPGERLSRLPAGHRRDSHGRLLPTRERPHGDRGPAYPRG